MANDQQNWYYRKTGGDRFFEFGPFTQEELFLMYMKGNIAGDTDVRCGDSPWLPLRACFVGSKFSLKIWMETTVYKIFYCLKNLFSKYSSRERKLYIVALSLIVVFIIVKTFIYPTQKQAWEKPQQHFYGSYRADAHSSKTKIPKANNPSFAGVHPLQQTLTSTEVLRLTNVTRSENGVHELKESFLLNAIAEERVKDMFEKQYFDHISPAGEKASDIARRIGYRYKRLGENLGGGSFLNNQKIIDGWMQSPGHRKNLMSKDYEEIGIAVMKGRLKGDDTWIAVQVFGRQSPLVD